MLAVGSSPNAPGADGLTLTHAGSNTTWYCVVWLAPYKDLALPTTVPSQSPKLRTKALPSLLTRPLPC